MGSVMHSSTASSCTGLMPYCLVDETFESRALVKVAKIKTCEVGSHELLLARIPPPLNLGFNFT